MRKTSPLKNLQIERKRFPQLISVEIVLHYKCGMSWVLLLTVMMKIEVRKNERDKETPFKEP